MLRKSTILAVSILAFGGLCITDADAKKGGMKAKANFGNQTFSTSADADFRARRSLRHQRIFDNRPHGWSQGRKRGWNCEVGERGCVPPGLRNDFRERRWID